MKAAILSDVHGNLEALRSVLAEIREWGADVIHALGDTVGYGPHPGECIDLLRREAQTNLLGNHDAAVVGRTPCEYFNRNARLAVEWTRGVIGEEDASYLASLPYTEERDGLLLVHASPLEPAAWHYVSGVGDAAAQFRAFSGPLCCIGHTHVPFVMVQGEDGGVELLDAEEVVLRGGCRYLVNAGSVGQPRDGDPRAACLLLDTDAQTLRIMRVRYAIGKTQEVMRRAALPDFLVERLAAGC